MLVIADQAIPVAAEAKIELTKQDVSGGVSVAVKVTGLTATGGNLTVGGNLNIGDGGPGSMTQAGGSVDVTGHLTVGLNGGTGTYNLSGTGSLSANFEFVSYDGTGFFSQSGGTNTVANNLYLAAGFLGVLDRGYVRIEEKLSALGADIRRVKEQRG